MLKMGRCQTPDGEVCQVCVSSSYSGERDKEKGKRKGGENEAKGQLKEVIQARLSKIRPRKHKFREIC